MKLTSTYDLYEIVKVPFPFVETKNVKLRPAVVLSSANSHNERLGLSIMAMVTSIKLKSELWPSDIIIQDLEVAGLPVPSLIRFKIFTLDHRLIIDKLGSLSKRDSSLVKDKLKEILKL